MKKSFSKSWISSKQPRKQRKYRANAPLHLRKNMMSSHLSKDLRTKYKKRSVTPRKEDTVKIMRGKFKGRTGKIMNIDLKKLKVNIEGIEAIKKDGKKRQIPIDPSKIMITQLNLQDKERKKLVERKQNG